MVSHLAALIPKDDLTSVQSFRARLKVEQKALGVGVVTESLAGDHSRWGGWLAHKFQPPWVPPLSSVTTDSQGKLPF